MGNAIARRISRLERATGGRAGDELVEVEFSEEDKAALRDILTGLYSPEQVEAIVTERRLVPRSLLGGLSPEARAPLEEELKALTAGRPPVRPAGGT